MILVMLSGGLDSTAALVKLLKETSEPLHVHHISIKNVENRSGAEFIAVSNIIKYCQENYRNFVFTSNIFGFMQFKRFIGWDNDIVRFIAAQICQNNPNIQHVALGKCKDDDDDSYFASRVEQSKKIWDACFYSYEGNIPGILRPVENMTKKDIWEYLPSLLRNITWSCRTPIVAKNAYYKCGKCKTCKQMINYGLQIS